MPSTDKMANGFKVFCEEHTITTHPASLLFSGDHVKALLELAFYRGGECASKAIRDQIKHVTEKE